MPSSYPGALDTLSTGHVGGAVEIIQPDTINDLADAVNKIEAELGINPKVGYTTVADRLAAIGSSLALVTANRPPAESITADITQAIASLGTLLTVPTGYPGGDVVEPSVLYDSSAPFFADANGRNGYEYALMIGGYYTSNALYENPNLWVSHDGYTWIYVVFSGGIGTPTPGWSGTALTPIVPSGVQGDGNMSDPYLVRGPDGYYYILWNQFLVATGSGGTGTGGNNWATKGIKAKTLAGPWSAPVTMLAQVTSARRDSSPSALWDGTKWHIYTVDLHDLTVQPPIGHYTATDLLGAWAVQASPSIPVPAAYSTRGWWHLNAYRWGSKHVLVIQDNIINSSGPGNMWLVGSDDGGATWSVPSDPFMKGSFYRSALVATRRGDQSGFDHFYGTLVTNWALNRNFISLQSKSNSGTYGGLRGGVPVHPSAVNSARVPLAPFLLGDAVIRADSAVTPGSADSGQAYTVSTGTVGVASHALYGVAGANSRAAVVVAGAADGIYAAHFKVVDLTQQNYLIARYADASNYVRFGWQVSATTWKIDNIVAGVVSQTLTFASGPTPASGDIVALLCVGSTITVFVNGASIGQVTGWTANQAASGIGVQFANISNARITETYMRPLVGGA